MEAMVRGIVYYAGRQNVGIQRMTMIRTDVHSYTCMHGFWS